MIRVKHAAEGDNAGCDGCDKPILPVWKIGLTGEEHPQGIQSWRVMRVCSRCRRELIAGLGISDDAIFRLEDQLTHLRATVDVLAPATGETIHVVRALTEFVKEQRELAQAVLQALHHLSDEAAHATPDDPGAGPEHRA